MPGFTRRNVLKSGAALAGGGVLTALSPQFVRGVTDLLILGQQGPNLSGTQTIEQFSAGAGPQELGIQDRELMEPQGPNAIAARADGSLAILDTVNRRVAIVRGSSIERTISLPGAIYPTDLQEAGGRLFVLDGGGNQILEVDNSVIQRITLPAASYGRTSGLMDAGNGAVAVIEEGLSYYRVAAGRGSLAPGFPLPSGEVAEVEYEHPAKPKRKANIELGSKEVKIKSTNFLGSVTVAGVDAAGRDISPGLRADSGADRKRGRPGPDARRPRRESRRPRAHTGAQPVVQPNTRSCRRSEWSSLRDLSPAHRNAPARVDLAVDTGPARRRFGSPVHSFDV
jgi:hypothetical protein